MTKKEKLYRRILSKPKDLRFEELEKVLLDCGYQLDHQSGSHCVYTRPDSYPLTIPKKTPVKSYLIDQVLESISDFLEDLL